MVRIKVCGITNVRDALFASQLGVDALGFVFFKGSPRFIEVESALAIIKSLPAFVSCVGLFVNTSAGDVEEVLANVALDILQFHGDESPEFCRQFKRPYIKAVRVRNQSDIIQAASQYYDARALLFDAYVDDAFGGTGISFDWQMIPDEFPMPWVLSGGLNAGNIAEAIRKTKAQAVDVSSGVEQDKGIKCPEKLTAFIQGVERALISVS